MAVSGDLEIETFKDPEIATSWRLRRPSSQWQQQGEAFVGREYFVYIMTDKRNTVLYTGVTNDLGRRAFEHKTGSGGIFTKRYNVNKLIHYEVTNDIRVAISREKQIKSWARRRKEELVHSLNPNLRDLSDEI